MDQLTPAQATFIAFLLGGLLNAALSIFGGGVWKGKIEQRVTNVEADIKKLEGVDREQWQSIRRIDREVAKQAGAGQGD